MADNLLSLVSQFITPDAIAKIAEGTGADPGVVQKLVGASVPALMASMATAAASADGAKVLADAVGEQDPAVLDNLKASFGGENQIEMAVNGSKMLGSVIGDDKLSALTAALSKFSGADSETTESVLGVLGPAVTGVLGQQDPGSWSDPAAIAATFAAQKDNIMAAMPSGLGALLGAGGLAGAMTMGAGALGAARGQMGSAAAAAGTMAAGAGAAATGMAAQASAAASGMAANAGAMASGMADKAGAAASQMAQAAMPSSQPEQDGGIPSWVYILIAVAVIAALAYFFYPRAVEKKAEAPMAPQTSVSALI